MLLFCSVTCLCITRPASAKTTLTPDAAKVADGNAGIAAVLVELDKVDAAILAQDAKAFARSKAPEMVVNSPSNRVFNAARATKGLELGLIDYNSIDRTIEYVAVRPNGEVLWMGQEVMTPKGKTANAGKTEMLRVSEVWRQIGSEWKLSLRQATIYEVK